MLAPAALCRGDTEAPSHTVAQFKLEMMPLWFWMSSALISGITAERSILNAWKLSAQTHPRLTAQGAALVCSSPAALRTISTPQKPLVLLREFLNLLASKFDSLIALRADARSTSSLDRKITPSRQSASSGHQQRR